MGNIKSIVKQPSVSSAIASTRELDKTTNDVSASAQIGRSIDQYQENDPAETIARTEISNLVRRLDDMLSWALEEDWFPGGIDFDEVNRIAVEYSLSIYYDVLEVREALLKTLDRALNTYTGRKYALEKGFGVCKLSFTTHHDLGPSFEHFIPRDRVFGSDRVEVYVPDERNTETRRYYNCRFEFPEISNGFESEYSITDIIRQTMEGKPGWHALNYNR